jgi:D12 class N6 adenine-specific DNA methyltransferase
VTEINRHFEFTSDAGVDASVNSEEWIRLGLLSVVGQIAPRVPSAQFGRLKALAHHMFRWSGLPAIPDMLFSPTVACALGSRTCLVEGDETNADDPAASFLIQMLPVWAAKTIDSPDLKGWMLAPVGQLRMYTLSSAVWNRFEAATHRMSNVRNSRAAIFAKSASYMGSKAALSAQLCEIIHEYETPNTVVVDLMCGSGAMSGAFAKTWPTIASDAQMFSRLLARVQGGGMTSVRAVAIADAVLESARQKFETMPMWLREHAAQEDEFIHKELTEAVFLDMVRWLQSFDLERSNRETSLGFLSAARADYSLFTNLYANLFFGVRQAYEIDCLRFGIDNISDPLEKEWALGALICATSQCAFTYGGHFAQPKLDVARPDNIKKVSVELLQKRSLSVSHEFYSRLVSLSEESENIVNGIQLVAGPWQSAIDTIRASTQGRPVCVYLDPPYTRDEYSRYYHVLETLVRYESGPVSGKGRIPARGSENRFASPFNLRNSELVEEHIASILRTCLENGWSCLWSYSSSGMASIVNTLAKVDLPLSSVEVFSMDHTYKAQGKRGAKKVTEYATYLRV